MNYHDLTQCLKNVNLTSDFEFLKKIIANPSGYETQVECLRRCIYQQLKILDENFNINVRFILCERAIQFH